MKTISEVSGSRIKDGFIDFIAGSMGGISVVYVGQPLDTVKVKMQTFPSMYNGMLDCFMKTYKNEGVLRGLYAGTTPAIVANVAENSVLFACYGLCQKLVARITNVPNVEEMGALSNATAGSLASFFSSFTLCPTELIKVKLQCAKEVASASSSASSSQAKLQINAFKLTRYIIHQEGIPGLFRGLQSTIIREMPGYFVFFGAYEGTRTLLTPEGKTKDECGLLATIVAGAFSGIALWVVIYPVDAVKSRIQVSTDVVEHNIWRHVVQISKHEGILSLYHGLQPTLIRTVPATAALFLSYEWTKKFLHGLL